MVNFSNPKHTFWQALVFTILIFWMGLMLGVSFEQWRTNSVSEQFVKSETLLLDSIVLSNLVDSNDVDSRIVFDSLLEFADKVYSEAKQVEDFDTKARLSDDLVSLHKKYDLLRTILWINGIQLREDSSLNAHTVVYLYEYSTNDFEVKALNTIFSRSLEDLKAEYGSDLLLIPIAVDLGVESLDVLLEKYNVQSFPAVFIDESIVITDSKDLDKIIQYLN